MAEPLTLAVYTADVWEHVCPVVRVTAPAEQAGITVLRGASAGAPADASLIPIADAALLTRTFPARRAEYEAVLAAARAAGKPVIYELDDLLTELPPHHPDYAHFRAARAACLHAALHADACIASTPAIRDYLRRFNPGVHLFHNYFPDYLLPPQTARIPPAADEVVIGFMGGHSHIPDVEMLAPALLRLARRYWRTLRLRFWGAPPPPFVRGWANVDALHPYLVRYADFVPYFAAQHADIFIAPLLDNEFNRGKSHLKFLEYSLPGIPGVYSRLPPYEAIVRHGENGFLAGDLDEWEAHLSALIESADLRRAVGQAARQTVLDDWLLSRNAHRLRAICEEIVAAGTARRESGAQRVGAKLGNWYDEVEAQLSAAGQERARLSAENAALAARIEKTELSKSWLAFDLMRKTFDRLFPPDRKHGRFARQLLRIAYRAYGIGRAQGWRVIVRNPRMAFSGERGPQIVYTLQDGAPCAAPAVTVVVLDGDVEAAVRWAQAQTIAPLVDVAGWAQGKACLQPEGYCRDAPDLPALLGGLRTPYLCVASADLLAQPETYLETNLIALETGRLAFTVNLRAPAEWARTRLAGGFISGGEADPLGRVVAHRDALLPGWRVDPGARRPAEGRAAFAAGRVLFHRSSDPDAAGSLEFETALTREVFLFGDTFICQPAVPFTGLAQAVHPVKQVIPALPAADPRPTVLVLISFLAVGGAERLLLKVMERLAADIRFVVMTVEAMHPAQGTTAGQFRALTPYVYQTPDFLPAALTFEMLDYLLARFQPVSLYIPNGANWIFDNLERLRRRHPRLRLSMQIYDHREGWINRYDAKVAAAVDLHIAPNPNIMRAYVEKGVHLDQIACIEHGIDLADVDPAKYGEGEVAAIRARLGLPAGRRIVAFVARLYPQKRPLDFVELARRFAADEGVHFLMVGDGVLREQVIEQISRSGLANFTRLDFYKPIPDIYAALDVLVLPSEYEAMPLVVAETLAMGKPVVVTDAGNNREVVELAQGGVVTPVGDVAALMRGVQAMLASPPDPARLRAAIRGRFDINVIAEKHRAVFLPE
jgi:glycosyltransferase involved in cell wall biosynthesis